MHRNYVVHYSLHIQKLLSFIQIHLPRSSFSLFSLSFHMYMLPASYVRHIPSSTSLPTDVVLHVSSFGSLPFHKMVHYWPYLIWYVWCAYYLRLRYTHPTFVSRSRCLSYIPPQIYFPNPVPLTFVLHNCQHSIVMSPRVLMTTILVILQITINIFFLKGVDLLKPFILVIVLKPFSALVLSLHSTTGVHQ